ncbi:putative permease [Vibrio phage nt-1]|uniref:Permease n=1 Tax=Vibrio phage nt-1 TaxID=115992 RepID=R9TEW8_9CAUD|nr:putative permease [Vibrio phage nt-1]AGN30331.1 putative permease [Vibrio phage nt-1]
MILFGHVVGTIGMILICLAFWMVTSEKYKPTDDTYLWTNMSGAILLTISLLINFNLGSFMIELFWMYISGTSLYKNYKERKNSK